MAMCQQEIDQVALKLRRAASRARSLHKKRAEYERAREARSQAPPSSAAALRKKRAEHQCARAKPHRLARTATRTCLAKGLLEATADMPSIVSLEHGMSLRRRKPSVAPMMTYGKSDALDEESDEEHWCYSEEYLEICQHSVEPGVSETAHVCKFDIAEADTTASEESDIDSFVADSHPGSERTCGTPVHCVIGGALEMPGAAETNVESQRDANEAPVEVIMGARVMDEVSHGKDSQKAKQGWEERQASLQAVTRREEVLCGLVRHLHAQAAEERERAHAAEAEKLALEAKSRENRPPCAAELRRAALKCERQRAASMRKRRQRETEICMLRQKADRALKDALKAKEEAEAEAIAERARHLAHADIEARNRAEAITAAEVTKAQVEADEMVQQRLAEIEDLEATSRARAQAEAEAVRAQAEREAAAAKTKAEEARAQVQAEARAMKVRAEVEARVIKARAELEVRGLRAEMEAKRHDEHRTQDKVGVAGQLTEMKQKPAARGESTAATLRRAKSLQQQQAKQYRRQAEEERRREQLQEQELRECRARAEEEAKAIRAQALASVKAMKVKVREEAQAVRARVEAEARHRAEQEAGAMRAAAEADARDIRDRAEKQAQELRTQVRREQGALEAMKAGVVAQPATIAKDAGSVEGQQEQAAEIDWQLLLDDATEQVAGWSVIA